MISQGSSILRRADETTADILAVMIEKESSVYRCQDYLHSSPSTIEVTADDRKQLVDWCFSIVDICSFQRETVAIAVNLLDRFLSIPSLFATECLEDRREFQLLALSCLYIAIKTNERVAFSSKMLSDISHGGYSVQEIEYTEKIILCGLSWRVNGPTCLQMALHILSLMGLNEILPEQALNHLLNEVQHQTENATRDYYISIQRPSTVALTILIKTFQQLDYQTRVELITSLLPILQSFDFDSKCKRSIAAGFKQSEARVPTSVNIPSCVSISSDGSIQTVPGYVPVRSLDKL